MIDSTTTRSSAYSTTTLPAEWDAVPCVQYGFPEDKGPIRAPKLKTIFEPVPEGANTASPVYLLTPEEYERQDEFESGYEVSGTSFIGKELQDGCEDDDRVLYPIHIESDAYHEESAQTLIEWFREFTDDWLGVPFHECSLYFSGNRSIHVHLPRFVNGEEQRERLKGRAETFCEETGAELDVGLYHRKRLFRLPSVTHESSTLPKVQIEPEWEHDRIISEAASVSTELPASYAEVLRDVFVHRGGVTTPTAQSPTVEPHAEIHPHLDLDAAVLELECDEREIETPSIERVDEYPDDPADVPEWSMYNTQEFSPYAHASGNPRSVAVIRVKGGAFAREEKRGGATMIPAYFYGAVGCNGEFTKQDVHAPLQLSKKDYRKWDYEHGEKVVLIGGKSGNSRIFSVSSWEATEVGHALTSEEGGRDTALDYLSEQGYNVGASGSTVSRSKGTTALRSATPNGEPRTIWPARENPQTTAEALQRKAEQDGIVTLSHNERIRVACRHLQYGWQPTWEWFKEQYGSAFKPEVTWWFLKGIVEDPDFVEYDHVDIPPKPT
ncbi:MULTISPECIES: hypothetical protein [unclassified Natrinema]|uniref:hypothetical protein n=1 Tax=unclassified Natrinema TaxID=2622230 RepID=UPI001E64E158|nr:MULTISPECIES: hypothetical protein [unclassified Natrinema]